MGLFNLVPGWQAKVLDDPLDAKMTQMLEVGKRAAREKVHKDTWQLHNSISGGYNKSTKTSQLWADKEYALIEEMRAPIPSHSYLGPAAQAMAGFWGGTWNIELHFPNAAPAGRATSATDLAGRESRWRKSNLGLLTRARGKVKVVSRRWHKRFDDATPIDPTTPTI